jgi:hypothetical protein
MMIAWKVVPKWMDHAGHAAGLWRRRQNLRRAYEAVHGCDPALWPTQHPGVVVDGHAACLGCHWMQERGYYRHDSVFQYPVDLARRDEGSNGTFCGGDGKRPTARLPSPLPVKTPRYSAPHRPHPAVARRRTVCSWHPSRTGQGRLRPQRRGAASVNEHARARSLAGITPRASCKARRPGNRWHTFPCPSANATRS